MGLVTKLVADVKVGDIVVFGYDVPAYDGTGGTKFKVIDTDPVVNVDAKGIHFAGGTYIEGASVLIDDKKG